MCLCFTEIKAKVYILPKVFFLFFWTFVPTIQAMLQLTRFATCNGEGHIIHVM